MSDTAKVTLSDGQLSMAMDKNIILTKRAVTEKAFLLFSEMLSFIKAEFEPILKYSTKLVSTIPKIYKGENYKGFPYVMMDYPALFEKQHVFAVRTMFWWGNFISITLHLSGEHKLYWQDKILQNVERDKGFFIAVGDEEWQHHFDQDNYTPVHLMTNEQNNKIRESAFMKVAIKYELHHWNMMQSLLPIGYKKMAELF